MDEYPRRPSCGTGFSWMMPWMTFQGDHVALQGFSWLMPWMIIQVDHVAVQVFS